MPIVSVVIPSFNRGHCIRACVESVLLQTFDDFEVLIVDDASTDDTRQQVATIADPRVRYLVHEKNKGGAASRNTGIRESRGEFVAFLDSDDRWSAGKLEKQLRHLREKGDTYGFVYTWYVINDSAGEEIGRSDRAVDGLSAVELIAGNCIGTFSSVMARRGVLEAVGGLDEEMRSCQDWDLYLRLNAITKVCCVEEYLVSYLQNRRDRHRISANPTSVILGHRRMLEKMEPILAGSSARTRLAALRNFVNVFVIVGALRDMTDTNMHILRIAPSIASCGFVAWSYARAVKRLLLRDLGY